MKLTTKKTVGDIIFTIFAACFMAAAYWAYKTGATALAIAFGIGCLLIVIVTIITRKKIPKREDYEYFEYYCTQNQYEKMDFHVLEPEIRDHSYYINIKGKFSTLYSNPAKRLQYIAAITGDTDRYSHGMMPDYTLLIMRGKQHYCEHCLAFTRKSRENFAFEIVHGKKYNILDLHPTIQFYSTEISLAEETVQRVAGIIEHLGSSEIYIECVGSWLLAAIHHIPKRRDAPGIFEFFQNGSF